VYSISQQNGNKAGIFIHSDGIIRPFSLRSLLQETHMQKNFRKVLPQYLVPQHAFTRLLGWMCESRWSWLKSWMINTFIRRYNVDMKAAIIENPDDYPTFNEFFTRHLKPELRPIVSGPDQIACPVDGQISQIGKIDNDTIFQAKGFDYSLNTLLGGDITRAKPFLNGNFATIYLSPKDYHRIHMPISGTLRETIHIPGSLFSVNTLTTATVPNLFARNERLVCLFDTEAGPMAVILVGAMLVGSIHTAWDNPARTKTITKKTHSNIHLDKGAELGYFQLGSTVIMLFAENKIKWEPNQIAGTDVRMGELQAIKRGRVSASAS
jgi:phosphatidylserine decarboxylase